MKYWALKTTRGVSGQEEWPTFRRENVVAIGWHNINVNPALVTRDELIDAVGTAYPEASHRTWKTSATCIRKFVDFAVDDLVLVVRGYAPQPIAPVYIYGFARVTAPFVCEPPRDAWRFKHKAKIQRIERYYPRELVTDALNLEPMRQTIHTLTAVRLEALAQAINVPIAV